MTKEERITLAIIMGEQIHEWRWIQCSQGGLIECKHCERSFCSPPWTYAKLKETEIFCSDARLLDPEVFAHHDYVCLLWARENWRGETTGILWKVRDSWRSFKWSLTIANKSWQAGTGYIKGDYAKAILAAVVDTAAVDRFKGQPCIVSSHVGD